MVAFGEIMAISQSSILLPQFQFQASSRGRHSLPCYQVFAAASTDCSPICFLRTRLDPGVLSRTNCTQRLQQKRFFWEVRACVVPESKLLTTLTVNSAGEEIEILPDTSGGGDNLGGANGGGESGGGGNNWGNNNNEGEGESDKSGNSNKDKSKKMAMSMSQKLTLGYAALVGVGGFMGYAKSGSQKSLVSGGLSALLLYYVYTQLPTNPVFASAVGFGLSAALLGVMGTRFKKSGKIFPAGVVSLVSLVMSGGYLHGILRSMH